MKNQLGKSLCKDFNDSAHLKCWQLEFKKSPTLLIQKTAESKTEARIPCDWVTEGTWTEIFEKLPSSEQWNRSSKTSSSSKARISYKLLTDEDGLFYIFRFNSYGSHTDSWIWTKLFLSSNLDANYRISIGNIAVAIWISNQQIYYIYQNLCNLNQPFF